MEQTNTIEPTASNMPVNLDGQAHNFHATAKIVEDSMPTRLQADYAFNVFNGIANPLRALRPETEIDFGSKEWKSAVLQAEGDAEAEFAMRNVFASQKTVLRPDDWERIDDIIGENVRPVGTLLDMVYSAGLVTDIPGSLGIQELSYYQRSDFGKVTVAMDPTTTSDESRPILEKVSMHLPLVMYDCSFNIRDITAANNNGIGLDTEQLENGARLIRLKVDESILDGYEIVGSSDRIVGIRNTGRREVVMTGSDNAAGKSWLTATGQEIMSDITTIMNRAKGHKRTGRFNILVSQRVMTRLQTEDYKPGTSDSTSIYQRILQVVDVQAINEHYQIEDEQVIFIYLQKSVLDMKRGFDTQAFQWSDFGGMSVHVKLISLSVPQIRSTYDNQVGIFQLNTASA